MLKNILLSIIWLIIVPYFLGELINKKIKGNIFYTWLLGNIIQMAIALVISLPLILLKAKFNLVLVIYTIIIMALLIYSIIKNKKELFLKFKNVKWKEIFKNISIYQIVFIVLFTIIISVRFKYTTMNDDDSTFVVYSVDMIRTGKMYLQDGDGNELSNIDARRALAPLFVYYSIYSKLIDVHPTILIHTMMPIVFICMAFIVYFDLAKKLFKENDSRYLFMIFLILVSFYLFEAKGANKYFFLYTWFGRSVLAGIIIPFLWDLSFLAMNKNKNEFIDWFLIGLSVCAGCLCSEMAIPLVPISVITLAIINSIQDKKISYILKSFLCLIPCFIIGIVYIIIK